MDNNIFCNSGIKKTKQRESVLSVLLHADKPMTAMEIYTEAEKSGALLWLSTVYRILELFTYKGIINRNILAGGDMASYEINTNEHRHYAVCIACQKIFALDSCPIEHTVDLSDFHITGHKLEIYGYCCNCYVAN